jgi:hypothetical protein
MTKTKIIIASIGLFVFALILSQIIENPGSFLNSLIGLFFVSSIVLFIIGIAKKPQKSAKSSPIIASTTSHQIAQPSPDVKVIETEEQRIRKAQQEKYSKAMDLLSAGDPERLLKGAQWMIDHEKPIIKTSLIRVGKETKNYEYTTPYLLKQFEIIRFEEVPDVVYDEEDRVVANYGLEEIGELSKSVCEKLADFDFSDLYGIVTSTDFSGETNKVSVSIYPGSSLAEPGYRQLHTYISGMKYNNPDGSSRQKIVAGLRSSNRIKLVKDEYEGEPAVAVHTVIGQCLGYLKADFAEEFSKRIDRDEIGGVFIESIVEKEGYKYCDILINIRRF